MSVTIRDIARESGYAVGTVSRVLNHHPDVSETARQRVMAVVEAHGFTPNSNARHLKQSVSRSIAIIVKGSSNLLFADMVERAQNRMQNRGFDTAVHYLDEDANEVAFAQSQGDRHRLALVRISPIGPEHDRIRYVTRAFDAITPADSTRSFNERLDDYWQRGTMPC